MLAAVPISEAIRISEAVLIQPVVLISAVLFVLQASKIYTLISISKLSIHTEIFTSTGFVAGK